MAGNAPPRLNRRAQQRRAAAEDWRCKRCAQPTTTQKWWHRSDKVTRPMRGAAKPIASARVQPKVPHVNKTAGSAGAPATAPPWIAAKTAATEKELGEARGSPLPRARWRQWSSTQSSQGPPRSGRRPAWARSRRRSRSFRAPKSQNSRPPALRLKKSQEAQRCACGLAPCTHAASRLVLRAGQAGA